MERNELSPGAVAGPQRSTMLSGVAEAANDVRKACNTIKRMTSLGTVTMVSEIESAVLVDACREMAVRVLWNIGFRGDDAKVESVLPMMMEATSSFLASAMRGANCKTFGKGEMESAMSAGVKAMSNIAKSRIVAKMVEPEWPTDIDSVTSLRLSTSAALAVVAVEVAGFAFMHTESECIKEAGRIVVRAALDAAAAMAPECTSKPARIMLTQSLIASAAKVYAAAWRAVATQEMARLDALDDEEVAKELLRLESASISSLIAPVTRMFALTYAAVTGSAIEMFPRPIGSTAAMATGSKPKVA